MTDILKATLDFLKADAAVVTEVSDRVYGHEIPQTEIDRGAPRKFIVVEESGGVERNRFLRVANPRYTIWNFGATKYEATEVDRAVYEAFKILDRVLQSGVLLHNASLGGPNNTRDDQTGWPCIRRDVVIQADERTAS